MNNQCPLHTITLGGPRHTISWSKDHLKLQLKQLKEAQNNKHINECRSTPNRLSMTDQNTRQRIAKVAAATAAAAATTVLGIAAYPRYAGVNGGIISTHNTTAPQGSYTNNSSRTMPPRMQVERDISRRYADETLPDIKLYLDGLKTVDCNPARYTCMCPQNHTEIPRPNNKISSLMGAQQFSNQTANASRTEEVDSEDELGYEEGFALATNSSKSELSKLMDEIVQAAVIANLQLPGIMLLAFLGGY